MTVRLPAAPEHRGAALPQFPPLEGGPRRQGERGPVSDDGSVRQRYQGALNARAAGPGVRLVESGLRAEDFDAFEDMLYTAAVQAGWLACAPNQTADADVPDTEILIRISRRA